MSKITSVEPQKSSKGRSVYGRKNNRRYNIYLDGEFAFGADEDLVVDYRLIPGKAVEASDLEKLLQEAEVGKLMERMYRLFNIRQRSEKEVRNYLRNLSFKRKYHSSTNKDQEEISNLVIDSVIEKLKRKQMLNDLGFAKAWNESRSRKYGPQRIKQELKSKGIGREVIEEIFSEQATASNKEVAQKLLEKKILRWKSLPVLKFKKKAYEFLLRRGFEYDMVKNIVEKYTKKG